MIEHSHSVIYVCCTLYYRWNFFMNVIVVLKTLNQKTTSCGLLSLGGLVIVCDISLLAKILITV